MRLRLVQVRARYVADALTPIEVFERLVAPGEAGFILESVDQQGRWSRYSVVGRRPLARVIGEVGHARLEAADGSVLDEAPGILDGLRRWSEGLEVDAVDDGCPMAGPFSAAFVGHVGYEAVREREPSVPSSHPDDVGLPEARLLLAGDLAVIDHWAQSLTLSSALLVEDDPVGAAAAARAALSRLEADLESAVGRPVRAWPLGDDPSEGVALLDQGFREPFAHAVRLAKQAIDEGEVFQVVLSHRFELTTRANPLALYRALRLTNPSPYMYLITDAGGAIVGSSPEALATVRDGVVWTRPIAGSRPRGSGGASDEALIEELLADPKERAEHLMLVDLARNDVGRVARFGSVVVDEFMVPERFARVIHLTSSVHGQLTDGVGPIDALAATLPAGTLSGAPKVRAMQLIDELESKRRVVYGGVVGYVGRDGTDPESAVMDFAIAIRTAVWLENGRVLLQAGAGIVAGSDPEREATECVAKAAAVARAVAVADRLIEV
ncbi:Anthranilate synthase [Acidimicrobium ferrooxidans DSM 10331]|uniref:Anthranilate synthase component 1 n=1 Tax=Acidimicrobium ferrooxidans (strain DSM 10331 / JCM 15462 / NBRC 103882 / ICP) TaxID=525909 RepID=C7LZ78_ACIFD|nr:chorismate-binding protein [Acidimicrobium ferrooxidans]ACU54036.1 Anthranilate synthase [Acidimicrobium ferrooxidans DSM 10331]